MRIPANYMVHMSSKALLPPGHYNIVKECVNNVQQITHLIIGDVSTPENSDDNNNNNNKNSVNYEVVLRH